MTTAEAAVLVLRETDNPAVMWGDEGLLHRIAERAGLRVKGLAWRTSDAVLNNLSRSPGQMVPGYTLGRASNRDRAVRIFWLPEHAPRPKQPRQTTDSPPRAPERRASRPRRS